MKKEGFSVPWRDILRTIGISHVSYVIMLFFLALLVQQEKIPLLYLKGFVSCTAALSFFVPAIIGLRRHMTGRLLLCVLAAAGFLLPLAVLGLVWQPMNFLSWFVPMGVLVLAAALAASMVKGGSKRKMPARSQSKNRKR